jgi:hypothetical protein
MAASHFHASHDDGQEAQLAEARRTSPFSAAARGRGAIGRPDCRKGRAVQPGKERAQAAAGIAVMPVSIDPSQLKAEWRMHRRTGEERPCLQIEWQ